MMMNTAAQSVVTQPPSDFRRIAHTALSTDTLKMPTLPDLALAINHAVQNDAGPTEIAAAITRDPAIAAAVIKAANSAYSASRTRVQSIQAAVTRLGMHYVRTLVNRLVLQQMFLAKDDELQLLARRSWELSIETAAVSDALARTCTDLQADTAMLAGLLHMVGVLPLIRLADETAKNSTSNQENIAALLEMQSESGLLLLKAWGFPQLLWEVPVEATAADRHHHGPADYCDVVLAARFFAETTLLPEASQRLPPIQVFAKLGIQVLEATMPASLQAACIDSRERLGV